MKQRLRSFAPACAVLLTFTAAQSAWAKPSTLGAFGKRPAGLALPTGCPLGDGPQYQRFSPSLGRVVQVGDKQWVDFNPIAISKRAALLCNAKISGTAICQNACTQLWRADLKGTGNAVNDEAQFQNCTKRCAGVPTFSRTKGTVENPAFIAK